MSVPVLTKGNVAVVKKFVDADSSRNVSMSEMQAFWASCSDGKKLQFTQEALLLMPELAAGIRQ